MDFIQIHLDFNSTFKKEYIPPCRRKKNNLFIPHDK